MLRVFSASLVVNAGLILILLIMPRRGNPHTPPGSSATHEAKPFEARDRLSLVPSFWSSAAANDPSLLAGWLRNRGCPENIVRNIVTALINRQFGAQQRTLRRIEDFWLDGAEKSEQVKRRILALIDLEKEREKTIESVLQIPWYQAPWLDDREDGWTYFTALMTPDRAGRVVDLFTQFRLKGATYEALREVEPGSPSMDAAREIAREFNAALAQVLTPDDREELGLRFFEVGYFDVWKETRRFGTQLPPDQLREVLRILKPNELAPPGLDDDVTKGQLTPELKLSKTEQLRAVMGDERFGVFLQHHDGDFERSPGWSDEGKPAPETFVQLFDIEENTTKQLRALENDPMISETDRQAQARALLQQALENASALLPPHYLSNYLNAGGNWIGGLLQTYGP